MTKRLILTIFMLCAIMFGVSLTAEAQTTIEDGAIYWESSWNNGSGNHNIVSDNNPYITEEREIIINGYSFLDKNGSVIKSNYDPTTNNIQVPEKPDGTAKTMLHVHSITNRLGWTDESNIHNIAIEEEKTAEEFAEVITKMEGKTLIYVDKSGSMDEFVEEATRAFYTLDLSNVSIVIFAEGAKTISAEKINEWHNDMGSTTNIYGNLSLADEFMPDVQNVIIISDLADNHSEELKYIPSIKTVEILCPDSDYSKHELEKIKKSWYKAEVNLSIIK